MIGDLLCIFDGLEILKLIKLIFSYREIFFIFGILITTFTRPKFPINPFILFRNIKQLLLSIIKHRIKPKLPNIIIDCFMDRLAVDSFPLNLHFKLMYYMLYRRYRR